MFYERNHQIRISQKLINKITNGGERNVSAEIIKKLKQNTFVLGTRFEVVNLDFDAVKFLAPKTKKERVHVTLGVMDALNLYRQVHSLPDHSVEDILTPLFLGTIPNPFRCDICHRNLVYFGRGNSTQWKYYRCPECDRTYKMGADGKLIRYSKPKHLNSNTS